MLRISPQLRRLNYLHGQASRIYHDFSARAGLSDAQGALLYILADDEDSLCQRDLCILTGLPKQTVNSAVRALMAEECVIFRPGEGRKQLISLTEKGKALVEEKMAPVIAAENAALAAMTAEEQQQLLALMGQFIANLKKEYAHDEHPAE